ncbi:MAG TPA: Na+/H+ antiporter subunit E [candidate division Zixibacteria bacterium]|nr:Na+/H+ antiporter subunit E [candidate division Zixibacteria bacterium]
MRLLKNRLSLSIFLLGIWLLLSYPLEWHKLLFGVGVSFAMGFLFGRYARPFGDFRLTPKSFAYAIAYLFVFMEELVKSNIDVAWIIIHPKLPIKPGIVKVRTNLKSEMGRLALANSITLTPGTLTVETKGEYFYVHWIDVSAKNIEESTEKIVARFEKYLGVIFG